MTSSESRIGGREIRNAQAHVLQLCTVDATHAARSGYDLLGEYTRNTHLLRMPRRSHARLIDRFIGRIHRSFSVSDWYYRTSCAAEREARRLAGAHSFRLVHYMWGERDLGFPQYFPRTMRRVATFHLPAWHLDQIILRPRALRDFDAIILMCHAQKEFFLNAGLPESKLHVILHGVDCDYFCPSTPAPRPTGRFEILSVGNYMRDFVLLEQVCRACAPFRDMTFRVIAHPKYGEPFRSLPNVRFESGLTDAELLEAYRRADCLLMLVEDSTANNAVMEAMACGLPIVTQAKGGLTDYVSDKEGFLVRDESPEEIAALLDRLKRDEASRTEKARGARKRAEDLSWNFTAEATGRLYAQLLA